jgi:hypothetical protein
MSLGYNQIGRPKRHTTLPGATGVAVIRQSTRASPRAALRMPPVVLALPSTQALAPPPAPPPAAQTQPARKEPADDDGGHWLYGTATKALRTADGAVACDKGRVCMVYPMRDEGGDVLMRMKTADAETGQLKETWVVVYNAERDERYVCDFSLVP